MDEILLKKKKRKIVADVTRSIRRYEEFDREKLKSIFRPSQILQFLYTIIGRLLSSLPFQFFLAIFRNEIMTILTPSTSEGSEWGRSHFSFGGPRLRIRNVNILLYIYEPLAARL